MVNTLFTLDMKSLKELFPADRANSMSDDLLISHITAESLADEKMHFITKPFRFNGYLAYFCLNGELNAEINLQNYTVNHNSLVINTPGNICRISVEDSGQVDDINFVLIAMSPKFLSSIRFDFNSLYHESVSILDNPCIKLDEQEYKLCREYMLLAGSLLKFSSPGSRDAIRYLISSVFYFLGNIWTEKISVARRNASKSSVRSKRLFDSFIKLVAEHHNEEKNMSFYADKLCLSSKYLSKLVKNQTGRSAPEWIDAFIILEAKNLLKYTDLSIKEIVYKLNFQNQSVFYKYFKSHTGMTPTEYRMS